MVRAADEVQFEAIPAAVSVARRWLRQRLADWSPDGVEAAQLVVSELVTNVVLHGVGPIGLALGPRAPGIVLEVADRSRAMPVMNRYGSGASTGRGLLLVDGVAKGWGVRACPNGKGVWAVVEDRPIAPGLPGGAAAASTERGQQPPEWEPPSDLLGEVRTRSSLPDRTLVAVRILALPLGVYLEAQRHNDALMREFHWLAERGAREGVPARLVELATELRTQFAPATEAIRSQVQAAIERGEGVVDLDMSVPRAAWEVLTRFSRLLDEADEFCERGELLTLASPPSLRRFRVWYLDQVLSQVGGGPAAPWPSGAPSTTEELA